MRLVEAAEALKEAEKRRAVEAADAFRHGRTAHLKSRPPEHTSFLFQLQSSAPPSHWVSF
jgi:hypothetical protein